MARRLGAVGCLLAAFALTAGCTAADFTVMAKTAYDAKRFDEGIQRAREATTAQPTYAAGWYWLGVNLFENKQYTDAIQALQKCLTLNPSSAQTQSSYYYVGRAYLRLDKPAMAIPNLERAVALKPDDPISHNALGVAYSGQRQYDEARASYRRALALDPADRGGVYHANLGRDLYNVGDYAGAVRMLERAEALGNTTLASELAIVRRRFAEKGPGTPEAATRPPQAAAPGRAPGPTSPPPAARTSAAGSGFLLRHSNLVMTNHHVIADRTRIMVSFPSGESYPGRVVARDPGNDLALIAVQGRQAGSGGLALAINTEIRTGETVHAIGYPLGAGLSRHPSIVSGQISSSVGIGDDIARFRTTAPINPGNSGGPIVNDRGQVIGIAAAGLVRQGVEAIRFGIKASTASTILQQARVQTAFDIVVGSATPAAMSSADIFAQASPYVVLIDSE